MKRQAIILVSIFFGGALGTLFRFMINVQVEGFTFPLGTVIENLVGSLLLGMLTGYILHRKMITGLKEGLGIGFCGGFTTMSTLAADSIYLMLNEPIISFFIYISISLFGGMLLALSGMTFSTALVGNKTVKEGGDR